MTTSSSVDGEMQVIGYSLRFKIKTLTVSGASRTPGPLIRYNNMGVEDSYRLLHVDYKWGKGVITNKKCFSLLLVQTIRQSTPTEDLFNGDN